MKNRQKNSIDGYIKRFPQDVQILLKKMKSVITSAAPKAEEGISYGIPTFYLYGKYLVYFAGCKTHLSVYPATTTAVEKTKGLSAYKVSKGTLRFPLDKPIPFPLIKKFVSYRVREQSKQLL